MGQPKSKIETPQEAYIIHYPTATDLAIKQVAVLWTAEELGVEKDAADVRMKFTEGERFGLMTAQSILTQYELMIGGDELWGGRISKLFPRPEIDRMCKTFAFFEIGVHAPFYDLINKALNTATEEFYTQWKSDPVLAERIRYIEEKASTGDALEATSALALLEGVSLFSLFGYFKSFNRQGFNLIPHFVAGIDSSAKDENFHSMASSWLFRTCREERIAAGNHTPQQDADLAATVLKMAEEMYQHELLIIEKIFSKGGSRTITQEDLIDFVQDRVNLVLGYLGMEPMFNKEKGLVSQWFYEQLSTFKYSDFFATTQTQYTRNWAKSKISFKRG